MRFSLRSLLLAMAAVSLVLGGLVTGSIFWLVVIVALSIVALTYLSIRTIRKRVRFSAFSLVFVMVGWGGLILSLTARLPISDVPLWRSMYWHVTTNVGWFDFTGSASLAIFYILQTVLVGVIAGVSVQLSYYAVRKALK